MTMEYSPLYKTDKREVGLWAGSTELGERYMLTCTHSLPTLNPFLKILIEVLEAVLCLLAHSKHLRKRTFTHHPSHQSVELLLLNERCPAPRNLTFFEVEGMVTIEGTE
jgi:hypothetical protein